MYEISLLVLTYNQDFEKTKLTLNSIIAQEGVNFEIIFSDDCSKLNYRKELEVFFKSKNFSDYKININETNIGTIGNALNAIRLAEADVIKLISPGDFLAKKDTLKNWMDFRKGKNAKIIFGDIIYYKMEDKEAHIFQQKAMPQICQIFTSSSIQKKVFSYLGMRDQIHGVSMIVEKELFRKYLEKLYELGLKFCEDTFVHLAILNNDSISYYPEDVVWYEYGYGISNAENTSGIDRIGKDMNLFYSHLSKMAEHDEYLGNFKAIIEFRKMNRCYKLLFFIRHLGLIKYYLYYRLKLKFNARMTNSSGDISWFCQLVNE